MFWVLRSTLSENLSESKIMLGFILGIIGHCEISKIIESFLCQKTWIINWRKNRHLPSLGGVPDPWLAPMAVRSWLTGRLGVFMAPCLTMALPGGTNWRGEGPFGPGLIKDITCKHWSDSVLFGIILMRLKHVTQKIPQKCKQTSPVHRALFRNCFCRSFWRCTFGKWRSFKASSNLVRRYQIAEFGITRKHV